MFQEVHIFYQIVNVETDEDLLGIQIEEFNNIRKDEYLKYHTAYYMNNYIENDIYETGESFSNIGIKLHDQVRIQKEHILKYL